MATELFSRIKAEAGKAALSLAYRTKIEDPLNSLAEVNAFLGQGGSAIIYSNHIAYDDPAVDTLIYERYLNPQNKRHLIIPISHWNSDPANNPKFYQAAKEAERFFGIEIYRLIQNYMVGDPTYGSYTPDDANDNHLRFFSRLKRLRKAGTPTDLLIFPEGHRSEDGVMGPIEEGLTAAGKILRPSVYVPVGIHYNEPYERSRLNLRTKGRVPRAVIGQPTFQTEKDCPPVEDLMYNLAVTLPSYMRGPYA